ncbi:MFS transporter [Streptacidiphilus cavernicola]|uniref:MFS transporter n=1 Tax=Streptacidiphilus cavernicola TaxID=3342716 RepID=A0ABV6VX93_9ACTN
MPLPSRRWGTLTGVSLASFMTFLDNNVVNVALPSVQRDLHLSLSGLEWVVSAYILVFSGLMLVGGRLSDLYGRRRMFLTGLAVFTAASLLSGLAGSESVLILGRALQGVGAAMTMPSTLAIISATFTDPKERARAIGISSASGALSLALGPLTGGFISQHFPWGWIFLINVPIGVAAIAVAAYSMPAQRPVGGRSLDVPGLLASTLMLFPLTYALIEGHDRGWSSPLILAAFALAAAAFGTFLAVEARTADPMVDLSLFRSAVFSGGNAALVLWGFGVMGVYFFTAMYLQNVLGFSPTRAGAAFVPMALLMAVTAAIAAPVSHRFGAARVVGSGLTLIVVGLLLAARVGEHGSFLDLMPAFVALGIGSGFTMMPLNGAVIAVLPPERAGAASGILNTGREVSGLLGVTVIGAILTGRQSSSLRGGATPLHAFLDGYRFAIVIAAVIVAIGVPVALTTLRGAPRRRQPTPPLSTAPSPGLENAG